jgi:lysophospholipase L1-like esterase
VRRRLALRAVSTALGAVAALVLVEALLRVFHLAPTDGVATVTEAEFRSVPGLLAPGQDLVDWRLHALPHRVHTNSLGYRGREFAPTKAAGEIRILMVGDSFTYGEFVNDEETLPARLEHELGRWCAGVRVINAGIGGTTIDTHARMVERALPLRLDLVIETFSENDLEDLADTSAWDVFASNRNLKSHFPLAIVFPALRRLALWNFALDARARLRALIAADGLDPTSEAARSRRRAVRVRLLPAYTEALIALRDRLRVQEVGFVLALFPSHLSLRKGGSTEQLEWLTRVGGDAGITTVNLLGPMRESGQPLERLYLLPHDGHPSADGYAVAARFLANALRRGDGLKKSCAQDGGARR